MKAKEAASLSMGQIREIAATLPEEAGLFIGILTDEISDLYWNWSEKKIIPVADRPPD